ncbi:Gfo/Idh/MocA family oxidoreductase [Blastococcus sp. CT_GayMR16]|uniref:Gfo/Idh/MocA family protein n=1 Tax=Blastococcus sp. CT_GayMR16 TaxID=2559607 RepID=UPI0010735748|nr:Gfo/Idh/MocA family oxidoreductase [Blastococcus sp. CT_GayMR16]TFV86269.1 Gfo/Idh/MocA family oxidoreductase [Blastococcus sp. CT_GayMR16]
MVLRVGVIGVGWGQLVHVPAFRAVEEFEVVALCGRRQSSVEKAGGRLGIEDFTTDWEAFVKRPDLDVISISAPVGMHRAMLLAALAAGKHVLCEKPLSMDGKEGWEMVQAAEGSGLVTGVCFENRFNPQRLALWDFIAAGGLGTPYFASVLRTAPYWHPSRPEQSEWMYLQEEGGGYLNGMASHELDYLQTILGRAVAVAADVRTVVKERPREDGSVLQVDADDTSSLILRLESGALATVSTSVVGLHANSAGFELLGSDNTVRAELDANGEPVFFHGGAGDVGVVPLEIPARPLRSGVEWPAGKVSSASRHAMAVMLEEWLPAFEGKPSRVPTVRDGWRTQRLIDAARESSGGGGWIDLPESGT